MDGGRSVIDRMVSVRRVKPMVWTSGVDCGNDANQGEVFRVACSACDLGRDVRAWETKQPLKIKWSGR